jgi:small nuclear ribonucleoprotein D3
MLQGHQVTVEITSGQTYRGKLIEGALEGGEAMRHREKERLTHRAAEDNMNVQMENINVTQRDGRVTHLDRVYIRGSHVRLFIVPDMLR